MQARFHVGLPKAAHDRAKTERCGYKFPRERVGLVVSHKGMLMIRLFIWVVSLAAIGAALALAAGGPGTRFGVWDYSTGLGLIRTMAVPVIAAAGAAALALILALWKARGLALLPLIALVASASAAVAPLQLRNAVESNPFIHDITTDFDNPPAIIAAAELPRSNPPEYKGTDPVPRSADGLTVAEAQRTAFPEIKPLVFDLSLQEATNVAQKSITSMKMEVIAEGPDGDEAGSGWRIEAVSTSLWFGFKDDFIVRLTALSPSQTRIDVRSKSRVGGSDLGANGARVKAFLERVQQGA